MFEHICPKAGWCPRNVLDTVIELAIEIAREGREILDPIATHPREARHITDPILRGTIKELAQLDGAFVLDEDGTVQAACRYLDTSSKEINMTFGLGSRHLAGASISRETNAIAIVVSESAVVRIFYEGCLQAEILPELWLLSRHSLHLRGPVHQDSLQDVAIFTAEDAVTKAEQSR